MDAGRVVYISTLIEIITERGKRLKKTFKTS
jgi:hypothetical protein